MSETPDTAPVTPSDAGTLLRQAREAAGLHIAAVAAMLKVPVQRLEALEQGRYEALPDAAFVRALALSVCRALKVDPAPVLAALPAAPAPRLGPGAGTLGTPMPREEGGQAWQGAAAAGRRWPLWAALALVALAAVLWGVLPPAEPPVAGDSPVSAGDATASAPAATEAAPAPASVPADETARESRTIESAPADRALAPLAGSNPAPVSVPVPEAPAGATVNAQAGMSADVASAVLRLQVRAASWVQVIGASGQVWLQRTLQPGEAVTFAQDLPLAVTVGRADATDVWVRGQPFDLTALARNNVARFEVR